LRREVRRAVFERELLIIWKSERMKLSKTRSALEFYTSFT